MGENRVAAFFGPVGTFFEERYESFGRDVARLEKSMTEALGYLDRGEVLELPMQYANVGLDTLRCARRFSPASPALTAYTLVHGQRNEEALFEQGARTLKLPAAGTRLGLELGVLLFANTHPLPVLDRLLSEDAESLAKENNLALFHTLTKAEAHIPRRAAEKFQVLEHVHGREREECWTATLSYLKSQGKDLPYGEIETYSDFLGYLKKGGISYYTRVGSVEVALELVANRRRLSSLGKERPIAVVVGNKNDSNNAFSARYSPLLDQLGASGKFDVVYIEVETDRQAVAALTEVYRASGTRVSLAAFAGHGTGETIRFGGGEKEEAFWDVDDFANKPELVRDLNLAIAEDGQIFLDACSTGSPKFSKNLLRLTAESLPGREVFGTSIDNSLKEVKIQGGRLRDVKWDWGHREYLLIRPEGSETSPVRDWINPFGSVLGDHRRE